LKMIQSFMNKLFVRHNRGYALYAACSQGNLEIVKWIVDNFEVTADDVMPLEDNLFCPLAEACHKGHTSIAHWLVNRFDLSHVPQAAQRAQQVMYYACSYGHLPTVKAIYETFGGDCIAISGSTCALRASCYPGAVDVAEWIINSVSVNDESITVSFLAACESKQFHMAEYLLTKCHIVHRELFYAALIEAVNYGPIETVDWAIEKLDLDHESPRNATILYKRYNHLTGCERVKHIYAHLKLTPDALQTYESMTICINESTTKLVRMLMESFM